jgi:hypothetical protein
MAKDSMMTTSRVCPTFYTLGNSTRWGPFSLKSATSQERDFIA